MQASGNAFPSESIKVRRVSETLVRMEWNEVDLVQEFTVEGQCSKIKVRSCRITWDSLQVNTAQRDAGRNCMLTSAGGSQQHSLQDVLECLNSMSGMTLWLSVRWIFNFPVAGVHVPIWISGKLEAEAFRGLQWQEIPGKLSHTLLWLTSDPQPQSCRRRFLNWGSQQNCSGCLQSNTYHVCFSETSCSRIFRAFSRCF